MKTCARCGLEQTMDQFAPSACRSGSWRCRSCRRADSREWRAAHPAKMKEANAAQWRRSKLNPGFLEIRRATVRGSSNRLRDAAYAALGNSCACCSKPDRIYPKGHFLQIDHVANDGYSDRKRLSGAGKNGGSSAQYRLYCEIRDGRRAGLQLLCPDCNFLKKVNAGRCPCQDEAPALGLGSCA